MVIMRITDQKHGRRVIQFLKSSGVAMKYGYNINALVYLAVHKSKLWFLEDLHMLYDDANQTISLDTIHRITHHANYKPPMLSTLLVHCTPYDRAEILKSAMKGNKIKIASAFSLETKLDAAHIDLAEVSNRSLDGKCPNYLHLLIESGASVNGISSNSCTPISSTLKSSLSSFDKSEILHVLVDSGASVNHLTCGTCGPIHTATKLALESGNNNYTYSILILCLLLS